MEIGQHSSEIKEKSCLYQVTPFSKYLALALFVILPFLGGYIGYSYAPEKVVEVEKEVIREVERTIEKEVQIEQNNLVMRNVSAENYSLYKGLCPNKFTRRGQNCYWLFEMSSGKFLQELNKLAREQGIINDDRVSLTSLQYAAKDGERVYFLTGIADSGACCRLIELNVAQMKFSTSDDFYMGITASEISPTGRYIASAVDDLKVLRVVDLEVGEIIYEESIDSGSLNNTGCAIDGYANDIAFSEDEVVITYGIYSDKKTNECDFELLERREYKIRS